MEPDDYRQFPSFERNAASRKINPWGYIDARDGAREIRKTLQSDIPGSDVFIIANEGYGDVPLEQRTHVSILRGCGSKAEHAGQRDTAFH
jgi:hypothetical protein